VNPTATWQDAATIRDLTAAYNRAFDGGDVPAWLATFAPEGELVVVGDATYAGRADLEAFAAARAGQYHHLTTDPEVEVDGDQAVQQCSLILLFTGDGAASLVGTGRYVDQLTRTPAGWRFQRRTVTMLRAAPAGGQ